MQDSLNRQLRQHEIGGDAREVEQQRLDVEPAFPRRRDLAVDDVQVAVVDVGLAAVDLQPGPAVEYARAPAADLEDLTRPADVAQRLRVEAPAVVDREVPVAVGSVRPLGPRSAEGDRPYRRQPGQTTGDVRREGIIVHTATLATRPSSYAPLTGKLLS